MPDIPGAAGQTVTPGAGVEQNPTIPPPGSEGVKSMDGTPKPSEFFIIEGMGKVTPADVVAISTAKSSLEKSLRTVKREKADLEQKVGPPTTPAKPGDPPPSKDPELEGMKKQIAEDRQELIREKIQIRLAKHGIEIDPRFLNIRAEKLSDVDDAVQGFIDANETLVSMFKKKGEGTQNEGNKPNGTVPPRRTDSPGNPPPATDKEAEIKSKFDQASATGDEKLWNEANKELAEYRGEKVGGGAGPAI